MEPAGAIPPCRSSCPVTGWPPCRYVPQRHRIGPYHRCAAAASPLLCLGAARHRPCVSTDGPACWRWAHPSYSRSGAARSVKRRVPGLIWHPAVPHPSRPYGSSCSPACRSRVGPRRTPGGHARTSPHRMYGRGGAASPLWRASTLHAKDVHRKRRGRSSQSAGRNRAGLPAGRPPVKYELARAIPPRCVGRP
jgi:hypothetical protein